MTDWTSKSVRRMRRKSAKSIGARRDIACNKAGYRTAALACLLKHNQNPWQSGSVHIAVMKIGSVLALFVGLFFSTAWADECVDCHQKISPGIVADWQASKHAAIKGGPKCATCHGKLHTKADDAKLAKMPTAETCGQCHSEQKEQFSRD